MLKCDIIMNDIVLKCYELRATGRKKNFLCCHSPVISPMFSSSLGSLNFYGDTVKLD